MIAFRCDRSVGAAMSGRPVIPGASFEDRRWKHIISEFGDCQFRVSYISDDGLAAARLWIEPDHNEEDRSFVLVDGWCYRIGHPEQELTEDDLREMLGRLREGLPPVGGDYSGNYVVVACDMRSGRIAVQPDRWAMRGVYYTVRDASFVVGDRSLAVANFASAGIDGHSLLSLVRGTHMPFGRTLFSGVYRIMCGCYLDLHLRHSRLHVLRTDPLYLPVREITFGEATNAMIEVLRGLVRRLIGVKSFIDLTGGNDTRLTAAAIAAESPEGLGDHISWRVHGGYDAPDVLVASRIARLCSWNLVHLDPVAPADAPPGELQRAAALADGTCLVNYALGRMRMEEKHGIRCGRHVSSIGGELLRGFFWRHEMLALGGPKVDYGALLAYRLYASRGVNAEMLGDNAPSLDEHDEVLLEPYRQIGYAAEGRPNPYQLDAMYVHKLCYAAGAQASWLSGLDNLRLPLLSWELTQLGLTLPWEYRAGRGLVLRIIEELCPKLARIPNDAGQPMRPLSTWTLTGYVAPTLRAGFDATRRILRRYTKWSGPQTNAVQPPPASWLAILQECQYLATILGGPRIDAVLREVQSPVRTADSARMFYSYLTLELLFREAPNLRREVVFGAGPRFQ